MCLRVVSDEAHAACTSSRVGWQTQQTNEHTSYHTNQPYNLSLRLMVYIYEYTFCIWTAFFFVFNALLEDLSDAVEQGGDNNKKVERGLKIFSLVPRYTVLYQVYMYVCIYYTTYR